MEIYLNEEVAQAIATKALKERTELEFGSLLVDSIGDQYQLTRYWSDLLKKELTILEKLPKSEILELITFVFSISDIDKIAAICNELYSREFGKNKKNRLLFLEKLEQLYSKNNNGNEFEIIKVCIVETWLFDPTNRDNIVGKNYQEINEDAKFYREISDRSKQLLDNIELFHI